MCWGPWVEAAERRMRISLVQKTASVEPKDKEKCGEQRERKGEWPQDEVGEVGRGWLIRALRAMV